MFETFMPKKTRLRGLRRLARSTKGGILAVLGLTMPVVLLTTALCVDLGRLYLAKTKAEAAATLAVEAGLERYPDVAAAEDLAYRVALAALQDAGYISDLDVSFTEGSGEVSVAVKVQIQASFAALIGIRNFQTGSISTRATP